MYNNVYVIYDCNINKDDAIFFIKKKDSL
jgi:hypothetical protein